MAKERNPEIDVPILGQYCHDCHNLALETFAPSISTNEADHFGFMAVCFVRTQLTHSESCLTLVNQNLLIGSEVIARVMLKGAILLAWAGLEPSIRPLRWRAFCLVLDWRTICELESEGKTVDQNQKAEIEDRLREFPEFLTKKAHQHGCEKYKDPYQKTWTVDSDGAKLSIPQMATELKDPNLKLLYDSLSQHIHWTPLGFGQGIKRSDDRVSISFNTSRLCAQVLSAHFLALVTTFNAAAQHFNLPNLVKLHQLVKNYQADMTGA